MDLRGIKLVLELAPELPPAAIGSDELRTVLVNLIGNATKYNRDGGLITVRASQSAGYVAVAVEDTGIGIRASNMAHLFDEFYREKRPETRDIEGNGLGLAIVKRLAERVGGQNRSEQHRRQGLHVLGATSLGRARIASTTRGFFDLSDLRRTSSLCAQRTALSSLGTRPATPAHVFIGGLP